MGSKHAPRLEKNWVAYSIEELRGIIGQLTACIDEADEKRLDRELLLDVRWRAGERWRKLLNQRVAAVWWLRQKTKGVSKMTDQITAAVEGQHGPPVGDPGISPETEEAMREFKEAYGFDIPMPGRPRRITEDDVKPQPQSLNTLDWMGCSPEEFQVSIQAGTRPVYWSDQELRSVLDTYTRALKQFRAFAKASRVREFSEVEFRSERVAAGERAKSKTRYLLGAMESIHREQVRRREAELEAARPEPEPTAEERVAQLEATVAELAATVAGLRGDGG